MQRPEVKDDKSIYSLIHDIPNSLDNKERCPNDVGLVSVIIPSKNSGRTIGDCLSSINNQSYRNIEILLIDACSSDGTSEIAKRLGAQVISLDSERAAAKNIGLSHARGEFLLFIDSDMVLEKDVVRECVDVCRTDEDAAGVIIPERSIGNSFWVKVRDFERGLYAGSKIESARFFKKVPVVEVGGFDEQFVFFEESTLPQKIESLKLNVNARITSCIMHNESDFNLRKWLSKKRYYYDTAKAYAQRYGYGSSQLSIWYRLKTFTSDGKWKALLRHPILTTGLFVLKFLELVSSRV